MVKDHSSPICWPLRGAVVTLKGRAVSLSALGHDVTVIELARDITNQENTS
jgi:hypothetical protein